MRWRAPQFLLAASIAAEFLANCPSVPDVAILACE
jgi:hypothetical protein